MALENDNGLRLRSLGLRAWYSFDSRVSVIASAFGLSVSKPGMAILGCEQQLANSRPQDPFIDRCVHYVVIVCHGWWHLYRRSLYRSQAWYNVSSPSYLKFCGISSSCLAVFDGGQYLWIQAHFLRRIPGIDCSWKESLSPSIAGLAPV
ncbi:hypothetical protein Tco_0291830 [Tanacetum coccineum]